MNLRKQLHLLLPWFFVVSLLIQFLRYWSQLTSRVAVHFDAYGTPNGWAGKDVFAFVALASLAGAAAVFTACLRVYRRRGGPMIPSLYSLYYGMVLFLSALFWQVIWYNLQGREFSLALSACVGLGGAGLGYWVGRSRPEVRSAAAAELAIDAGDKNIIGIDVHRRPILIVGMLAALVSMVQFFPGQGSPMAARVLMVAVVAAFGYFTLLAATGFSYVVSKDGVQVRGLFRVLRTIPGREILGIDIQPAPPGRYGIRIWKGNVAYYWGGKRTVRLRMAQQNVFLGSNHPEYLLKLLQEMMADGRGAGKPS
jgi:hypothetical protein